MSKNDLKLLIEEDQLFKEISWHMLRDLLRIKLLRLQYDKQLISVCLDGFVHLGEIFKRHQRFLFYHG